MMPALLRQIKLSVIERRSDVKKKIIILPSLKKDSVCAAVFHPQGHREGKKHVFMLLVRTQKKKITCFERVQGRCEGQGEEEREEKR